MARSRNIKPGFFLNDKLAEIAPLGRILFAGLWTIADREGRLEDRPKRIKAELLPYDDCDVDGLLEDLHQQGLIQRYQVEGNAYVWVINFNKHQNPHKNEIESTIPAPTEKSRNFVTSPEKAETTPADSFKLIPDSPILMPDSFNLISDSLNPNSGAPREKEAAASPAAGMEMMEMRKRTAIAVTARTEGAAATELAATEEAKEKGVPEKEREDREVTEVIGIADGGEVSVSTAAAAVMVAREFGRPLSPLELDQIRSWEESYGLEILAEALKIAVLKGVYRLNYMNAILGEWEKANLRTLFEVKEYEGRRKQRGKSRTPPFVSKVNQATYEKYAGIYEL
ncbi:DnaD domain-containing protein [Dehalobacterium formicoaceticum]|uniref:DnaD domain protein n=1 Tax=Dehalobacterium formicoaceticum TaxID=51515 RepID=A0ABT1Y925_9FIRM|nr:DnaD domain protein [Dehalobacterium formicoaceticum]MCR6546414.1 DnaD domain protein [Dehalobacterium formicoaceticum]